MKKRLRVYWDSSCFIAWLKPEPARMHLCKEVLKAAAAGELEIVTSAISLAEVVRPDKSIAQFTAADEEKIKRFFKRTYFVIAPTDRITAEGARAFMWKHGLRFRDAIHMATAIRVKIPELHTFDGDFLKLNGKLGASAPAITEPHMLQAELPFDQTEDDEEETN